MMTRPMIGNAALWMISALLAGACAGKGRGEGAALELYTYDAETTNHMYSYVGYVKQDQAHLIADDQGRLEYNPLIKKSRPFIVRLSPKQVLVPLGFPEFDEAPWIAVGWRKNVEYCKRIWPDTTKELEPSVMLLTEEDYASNKKENPILDEYLDPRRSRRRRDALTDVIGIGEGDGTRVAENYEDYLYGSDS